MIDIKTVEVPKSPGVYKFINFKKQIIYVGKSKDCLLYTSDAADD